MITEYLRILPGDEEHNDAVIALGVRLIKSGGLVAFPTETVYGLGANALDSSAVKKIYAAKGRPSDNPLIMHIASEKDLGLCVTEIPEAARLLMDAFWPGPLTIIFRKNQVIPSEATGGRDTVAVRCPGHVTARRLISAAGIPIAAPSANVSGRPSPTEAKHVLEDLEGRVNAVIDDGPCPVGIESTIINVTGSVPVLLRPGSVTKSMIEGVLKREIVQSPATLDNPEAPGMKYTHYAPLANVIVVIGDIEKTVRFINGETLVSKERVGVFAADETADLYVNAAVIAVGSRTAPEMIARSLFNALRRFDLMGVTKVYCEAFYDTELGLSVMNRLEKAAGYNIIKL